MTLLSRACVSPYWYFVESMYVYEIFSIKEWRNLENQVRDRSKLLKIVPLDRPCATFYWSAIVNTALSCAIFESFDIE